MSKARNNRREAQRKGANHMLAFGEILGDFYEFLSQDPQPTTEEVRATFIDSNEKWRHYCKLHKLMNMEQLFIINVREAWNRHTGKPKKS